MGQSRYSAVLEPLLWTTVALRTPKRSPHGVHQAGLRQDRCITDENAPLMFILNVTHVKELRQPFFAAWPLTRTPRCHVMPCEKTLAISEFWLSCTSCH